MQHPTRDSKKVQNVARSGRDGAERRKIEGKARKSKQKKMRRVKRDAHKKGRMRKILREQWGVTNHTEARQKGEDSKRK